MQRRNLTVFCLILVLGAAAFANPIQAVTPTPSPSSPSPEATVSVTPQTREEVSPDDVLTFAQIQTAQGNAEILRPLRGPVDALRLTFTLPPEWRFLPGTRLELRGTSVISSLVPSQGIVNYENVVAGNLNVSLNGTPLQTEILSGSKAFSLTIPLQEEALRGFDGAQELLLEWDASAGCTSNTASSVKWNNQSRFVLPHEVQPQQVDLSRFPAPFYQPEGLIPAGVRIIVPGKPSAQEIQTAAAVAAGFGSFSAGKASVALLSAEEVDESTLQENNLIFVGEQTAFPTQADSLRTAFPILPESKPEDGIIQIAVSPWNPARQVMWLHADSQAGLLKAGEAVSSGNLIPLPGENSAVVAEVADQAAERVYIEDRTFADFGMSGVTVTDFGSRVTRIPFTIPPSITIGSEAYLDLVFNHSQMLDYLRSGIVVRLNQVPIGSARFSDGTAGLSTMRAMIPSTSLRAGTNVLEVQTDILPRDVCSDPRQKSLWVTIFSNSLLHLPEVNQPGTGTTAPSIREYALPFTRTSTLSNLVFIAQSDSPASWKTVVGLANLFGAQTFGALSTPAVLFSTEVSGDALMGKDIILAGQPSRLPLADLPTLLPVAFNEQDTLTEDVHLDVAFRIPQAVPLGYLAFNQNSNQAVLAVMGNSEEGIFNAASALLTPRSLEKLANKNFALVRDRSVIGFSIQANAPDILPSGDVEGEIPGVPAQEGSGPVVTEVQQTELGKPEGWILPLMIVSIVLILLILGIQIRHEIKRRRM